jgi:hypothetical protein
MCLTCYPSLRSLRKDNAALLAHIFDTGPTDKESDKSKAISPSGLHNDIASRAGAPHAWYRESIVDAAAVAYFLLDHDAAPPDMVTTRPVVLRRVSVHAAKMAPHQKPSVFLFPPFVIFVIHTRSPSHVSPTPHPETEHTGGL